MVPSAMYIGSLMISRSILFKFTSVVLFPGLLLYNVGFWRFFSISLSSVSDSNPGTDRGNPP